jgi:hypothetical protein
MRGCGTEFWTVLSECEVTVRGLTALIYAFIANCDKQTTCGPERESAILAARLYVSILRVPGSSAFNVFHSLVFQKCLELLRIWQSPSTSLLGRIQVDLLKVP